MSRQICHYNQPPYGLEITGSKRRHVFRKNDYFDNYMTAMQYCHDAENPTWYGLQTLLHERGIKSPRGHDWWSVTSLQYMVFNDIYLGFMTYGVTKTESYLGDDFSEKKQRVNSDNYLKIDAQWEPFIDRQYAYEARERIGRKTSTRGNTEVHNPLAGLLRCSKCGYVMARRINSGNGKVYFVHPDGNRKVKADCKCKAIQTKDLMKLFVDALLGIIKDEEIIINDDDVQNRIERMQADISTMKKDIERSQKSIMDAYYRLDRGVIDENIYASVQSIENERIERLRASIERTQSDIDSLDVEASKMRVVSLHQMIKAINDDSLTPEQVNTILKMFIERIEYTNNAKPKTRKHEVQLDIFLK